MIGSFKHARIRWVCASALLGAAIAAPSASAAGGTPDVCVVTATVQTTTSAVNASDVDNMSLNVSGGTATACVPVGTATFSLTGVGTGACRYGGTGVGTLRVTRAGGSYTGFAEWTVTAQGYTGGVIAIDSVVPDSQSGNGRMSLLLNVTNVSLYSPSGQGAECISNEFETWATATGTLTANGVNLEDSSLGIVKGCDTGRPQVGAEPSRPLQDVNNPTENHVDCRTDREVVDAPVGDVAALASATATPVVRTAAQGAADNAGIAGPQCDPHEYYQPKNESLRGFKGDIVTTGETGNHAGHLNYTRTASFTSGLTVGGSVTVKSSAILAGIEATLSISVHADWTTSNSEGYTIDLPPHSKGWIKYGHTHVYTEGHYFKRYDDCVTENMGSVKADGPYASGFKSS